MIRFILRLFRCRRKFRRRRYITSREKEKQGQQKSTKTGIYGRFRDSDRSTKVRWVLEIKDKKTLSNAGMTILFMSKGPTRLNTLLDRHADIFFPRKLVL